MPWHEKCCIRITLCILILNSCHLLVLCVSPALLFPFPFSFPTTQTVLLMLSFSVVLFVWHSVYFSKPEEDSITFTITEQLCFKSSLVRACLLAAAFSDRKTYISLCVYCASLAFLVGGNADKRVWSEELTASVNAHFLGFLIDRTSDPQLSRLDFGQQKFGLIVNVGQTRLARLQRKPGLDSSRSPEWSRPVGAKTRTGFRPEYGMESTGWSENPDWISPGVRNGVAQIIINNNTK